MLSKVPEVTIFFWIIKILATTIGETAADFLNDNLGLGLTGTTYIMSAALAIVLVFQFRPAGMYPRSTGSPLSSSASSGLSSPTTWSRTTTSRWRPPPCCSPSRSR